MPRSVRTGRGFLLNMKAYKLLRVRRDGTLGPLFINRQQVIPIGVWLKAENHPTKGFAIRPGWHVARTPRAPHLSTNGRVWMEVQVKDCTEFKRPDCQGGTWLIAQWMKVTGRVDQLELQL